MKLFVPRGIILAGNILLQFHQVRLYPHLVHTAGESGHTIGGCIRPSADIHVCQQLKYSRGSLDAVSDGSLRYCPL